jgi:hypothetical protein
LREHLAEEGINVRKVRVEFLPRETIDLDATSD